MSLLFLAFFFLQMSKTQDLMIDSCFSFPTALVSSSLVCNRGVLFQAHQVPHAHYSPLPRHLFTRRKSFCH